MKPTHEQVSADIAAFLAHGGTITTAKTYRKKAKMPASGKQKQHFKWSAPTRRPHVMYDYIETKR